MKNVIKDINGKKLEAQNSASRKVYGEREKERRNYD